MCYFIKFANGHHELIFLIKQFAQDLALFRILLIAQVMIANYAALNDTTGVVKCHLTKI